MHLCEQNFGSSGDNLDNSGEQLKPCQGLSQETLPENRNSKVEVQTCRWENHVDGGRGSDGPRRKCGSLGLRLARKPVRSNPHNVSLLLRNHTSKNFCLYNCQSEGFFLPFLNSAPSVPLPLPKKNLIQTHTTIADIISYLPIVYISYLVLQKQVLKQNKLSDHFLTKFSEEQSTLNYRNITYILLWFTYIINFLILGQFLPLGGRC